MTDLEKFIDTYKQFGIELKTYDNGLGIEIKLNGKTHHNNGTESEKFIGETNIVSIVEFTKEGRFITQGFWR